MCVEKGPGGRRGRGWGSARESPWAKVLGVAGKIIHERMARGGQKKPLGLARRLGGGGGGGGGGGA